MTLPKTLVINAYDSDDGSPPAASLPDTADLWALKNKPDIQTFLASDDAPDLRDWRHEKVGWGVVVPANPSCSGKESAELADYEGDPIHDLWKARGRGPVFRYDHKRSDRLILIHSARDGEDVLIKSGPVGTGKGCLPRYLLLYGDANAIPWDVQYALNENRNCFPGRLPLKGEAAKPYVRAAVEGFKNADARRAAAVVWAPAWDTELDQGMSRLMRDVIAVPVAGKMQADAELTDFCFVDGEKGDATGDRLIRELKNRHPAMVITTSHGETGPLRMPSAIGKTLGLPLDQKQQQVTISNLLDTWKPAGAVWYAHACCSAGSDASSSFEHLFAPDTTPDRLVRAIATVGSTVAPLPLALLAHEQPVRAFIGHVEPTFNYSLVHPGNGRPVTHALLEALYERMYRRVPESVGMAFRACFDRIGEMRGTFDSSYRDYNRGDEGITPMMVWSLLAANDMKTMVVLGDPAVTLPKG